MLKSNLIVRSNRYDEELEQFDRISLTWRRACFISVGSLGKFFIEINELSNDYPGIRLSLYLSYNLSAFNILLLGTTTPTLCCFVPGSYHASTPKHDTMMINRVAAVRIVIIPHRRSARGINLTIHTRL